MFCFCPEDMCDIYLIFTHIHTCMMHAHLHTHTHTTLCKNKKEKKKRERDKTSSFFTWAYNITCKKLTQGHRSTLYSKTL